MSTGRALSAVAGLVLLAATAAGALCLCGTGGASVRGVLLGGGIGASGAVLEAFLVARALALPRGEALRIVLGGFGIRLFVLVGVVLALRGGTFADPISFALSFVGGFLAGIPVVASAVSGKAGSEPGSVPPTSGVVR